ncbi:cytochrome P450 89A2-like [Curcuma longa]|uniref:cytochrome P450 89A2-like n=1 Tax=Curcuma longa TaxID=136217 RepID=UPI003D9F8C0F
MEAVPVSLLIPLSLCFIAGVFFLLVYFNSSLNNEVAKLPPGPPAVPVLGSIPWFLWRRMFLSGEAKDTMRDLHARYGPVVSLRIGSIPVVLVAGPALAHEALVELGAAFAGRYGIPPALRFLDDGFHLISTAAYGPTWRRLRLNLVGKVLHPSRVALFAEGRAWALELLVRRLSQQSGGGPIVVRESFNFGLFALLLFMCFGEKLEEKAIEEIMNAQRSFLLFTTKLGVLTLAPSITKRVFWRRRRTAREMQGKQRELLVPLIEARRENREKPGERVESYVDSLLDLELEAEGMRKKLGEDDIAALCGEFLDAGTETTAAALEWIMANLVKHGDIQAKLVEEMKAVVGGGGRRADIAEEDLERIPYLDAVVKEGLRRHPPAKSLLPHTATAEGETLGGYRIPKTVQIVFEATGVGWDESWEDAEAFRPERWEEEGVEAALSGREMRMMPFGAGRRACPAAGLAMLHLRYLVANLVWKWEWKAELEGEEVDMAEKMEFVAVMKNPLRARLVQRAAAAPPPPCE